MSLTRHKQLYEYWDRLRGQQPMPTRSHIDPIAIAGLLPFIALIERRVDGFFWRLVGTETVDCFGRDLTGERYGAHSSPAQFISDTVASFDIAFEKGRPVFDDLIYRSHQGYPVSVCRLICPLAADAIHPPMILQTHLQRAATLHYQPLADQAVGQLQSRCTIQSIEDVNRATQEWLNCAVSLPSRTAGDPGRKTNR
ncbi:MAG: PAS domain-containing protein [Alphaproteobacteria bacterium]|nr:PAS domain-containing protein [Alphaproteobacteria bacterium]